MPAGSTRDVALLLQSHPLVYAEVIVAITAACAAATIALVVKLPVLTLVVGAQLAPFTPGAAQLCTGLYNIVPTLARTQACARPAAVAHWSQQLHKYQTWPALRL